MTPAVAMPLPSHVSAVAPRAGSSESSGAHAHSFDSQLDAARQQHKQDRDAPRPARDGASNTARHDTAASSSGKLPSVKDKSSATTPASAKASAAATTAAADPASELAAGSTLPAPATDAATDAKADPTTPATDDPTATTAAASLVGAMLAMLPTAAAVLQPGSGGTGTSAEARVGTQAVKLIGGDADTAWSALDDANDANSSAPTAATQGLLDGKGMPAVLAPAALAALDAGHDPAREQNGVSALLAAPATPAPSATLVLPVQAPVGSPAFGQELGQQVVWLGTQAGQGVKQASIRLHPEELGQLDIKVSVKHDRVDVVFSAQHPAAVTAVQQTLPQLNHLLAQHGMSLGHAEVGQQQNSEARSDSRDSARSTSGMADNEEIHGSGTQVTVSRVGLLDAFA